MVQQMQATTIRKDIAFSLFFDEVGKPAISKPSWQNMEAWSEFGLTTGTTIKGTAPAFGVGKKPGILELFTQNASASLELSFGEKIESGITQEFADAQQLPTFPFYNEEDILNLDAVIFTPPPLESGTIRVKLIYEEPSKPVPVEDPWEE